MGPQEGQLRGELAWEWQLPFSGNWGRKRQGRSVVKMSQNMGQIHFPQYVESRGQGEVLRPRDCALLWDSMGCL